MKKTKLLKVVLISFSSLLVCSCNSNSNISKEQNVSISENIDRKFTISFVTNGGSKIDSVVVKKGDTLIRPEDPVRDGYTFDGWYKDIDFTTKYNFSEPVMEDFILYAKWIKNDTNNFTIVFYVDGAVYQTVIAYKGDKLEQPVNPTKEGYTFDGWCIDTSLNVLYDFNSLINSSFNLYAKWKSNEFIVRFNLNYNNLPPVELSTVNGYVTFVPEREGYIFNGWWYCDGIINGEPILLRSFSTTTKVADNGLELFAEWIEEKEYTNQLDAPKISVNGFRVFWDSVNNCSSYQVLITAYVGTEQVTYTDERIYTNFYNFDETLRANTYTIKVRSLGDGINYRNSSYSVKTFPHKVLTAPRNYSYNEYKFLLQWDIVINADEYVLSINDQSSIKVYDPVFSFEDYPAGNYRVEVTAQKQGWVSSKSSYNFSKWYLNAPKKLNISFNEERDSYYLSWDKVNNANSYKVYINNVEVETITNAFYWINRKSELFVSEKLLFSVAAFDSNFDYFVSKRSNDLVVEQKYKVIFSTIRDGEISLNNTYFLKKDENVQIDFEIPENAYVQKIVINDQEIKDATLPYNFRCDGFDSNIYVYWNYDENIISSLDGFYYDIDDTSNITITGVVNQEVETLVVPDCVDYIEKGAFSKLKKLKELSIPFVGGSVNKNTNFGYIFGSNGTSENDIVIPKTLTTVNVNSPCLSIPADSFRNCVNLEYVNLSSGIQTIGSMAFVNCSKIKRIILDNNIVSIGRYAFGNCNSLEEISIPFVGGNAEDYKAFYYIFGGSEDSVPKSLKKVSVCNGCTDIKPRSFENCKYIETIIIHDSVTNIGYETFKGCSSLKTLRIPFVGQTKESNQYLAYVFGATSNEDYSKIPSSLLNLLIGKNAVSLSTKSLYRCNSIKNVVVPNTATFIADDAFEGFDSTNNIFFEGNSQQWQNIEGSNSVLSNIYYYSDVHKTGHWRYVDGLPLIWE